MKILVATIAIAATISSSAWAQSTSRQSRQVLAEQSYASGMMNPDQAFAQQYPVYRPIRSPNPAFDVYDASGNYLGSDPDPRVRSTLRSDPYGGSND
jgi:hypothetical protein